jgi:TolB-like protein
MLGWKIMHDRRVAAGSAPQIRSLAVLPLANLSGDPEQEYLSDGLTEELTTDLSKFSALRVISRTSMTHYKGTQKTVPEIARDLYVDAVIEGTVLRSGDHLRITVNLIQASPEKHLWAENYETEAGDLLNAQARVAQSVAREIQTSLRPPEQPPLSSHTVNPAAQDLYFRGLHAFDSETAEAAQNAAGYFQEAIHKDPTYAPAYAELALVQALWYPGEPGPRQKMPKAREAAQKAMALDETLSRAHRAMGYIELCYDWNWVGAEREFKRALELDPNDSLTHAHYAKELVILGRTDDAMAHVRQAVSLDPYSTEDWPVWVTYLAHRYDDALQLGKAKIALNPNYPWNHYDLALVYEQMGKSTESVQEYLKFETLAGADPKTISRLHDAFDKSGVRGFWRRRLEDYREAAKSQYVNAGMAADVCLRAGEKDCAFAWLEKAFEERGDLMINLNVNPVFDGIRTDPRFQDLVRRVGLPEGNPGHSKQANQSSE